MSTTFKEKVLLYRVQANKDPDAYAELYDQYVKRIYRFVFFKVGNHEDAEDITADVFLKSWNYLSEKKEIKSFSGLLYRIARNCVIDLYRARANKPESFDPEETELSDGGKWIADFGNQVEAKRIIQSLKKLKQEYQEVLTLKYVDELEIDEIAEITGKGNIAVRVTIHRATKKLQEILGK